MRPVSRVLPLLLLALLAWAPGARAAITPPTAVGTASGYGGGAATVDPYATKAAIDVLRRGGNAVDAAVAASAVLGVVEPYSSGIGGGGFMVLRTRNGRVETVDGREYAPAKFLETSFIDPATGQPLPFAQGVTSGLGVGVPGTLRSWQLALRRHGTLSLRSLLQPAIRLAREGFVVDRSLASQTVDNAARFADFPATAALFLPNGQPIQAGQVLRNPDLAATYRLIADKGVDAFYSGPVAGDIVRAVTQPPVRPGTTRNVRPGLMEAADLQAYRAKLRRPAESVYRGHVVAGMGPPSSGGSTVGEALNIMEAFGKPATTAEGTLHRFIEASRLAYADRNAYLGDPEYTRVPLACLLSQPFANTRRLLIGATAATSPAAPGQCPQQPAPAASAATEGPNTTNMTIADAKGNVVEYTFTIEQTGGSAITVPGRGFLLNNELTDFDFTPGKANSPAAHKRPRSSIAPTIVLRKGRPVLAVGSPGGASIITTVLQILVGRYEQRLTLPQAIAAPRVSERNAATGTEAEPAFLATPEAAALKARGHVFVVPANPELGAATGIEWRRDGRLVVASEPVRRFGGSAMVVRRHRR